MGIFRVGNVRVGVILGGDFPDGSYPGWEFSFVGVFWVGIVRWESSGWQFSCYQLFMSNFNSVLCKLKKFECLHKLSNQYAYVITTCKEQRRFTVFAIEVSVFIMVM